MTREELVKNLEYLISKYITSASKRYELYEYISRRDFYVAKGILDEIRKSSKPIEEVDSDLIKKIVFNFA